MFKTVLIANRGAIACRIIRTLKKLNIRAIAVYTKADADSLHVRLADAAELIGDGAAASSYLNVEKILAAAIKHGAQAIHPGYGFLSENTAFAAACAQHHIVFIGPRPEHITAFGLKHTARALAEQNNIPLSPGSGLLENEVEAVAAAEKINYPVMLKSTAGGGGIGMQVCRNNAELTSAFASVQRLSRNNFGNAGVFVEKYIERARHIEVQIFGDGKGGVLAIGERDCSLQRRNQKVIEETPAPDLSEDIRQQLHETAVRLCAAVNYANAGTVEFIYDAVTGEFYFLEVNTRLQVEHGVTEMVTGIDLVELMLLEAAGELPALNTITVKTTGHAIQARLYAEDPWRDFQPQSGLLTCVQFPESACQQSSLPHQLRIDHWIEAGANVSPFYDPMLAKIIVHAPNRKLAINTLADVIDKTVVAGIETNRNYLYQLLKDPIFIRAAMTTRYLNDAVYPSLAIDVLDGGTNTTVQDYPGRTGYWNVGVPPSGPFDDYSFRLGNRLLNNPEDAAGLEITLNGPTLKFRHACLIVLTGAALPATLDDVPLNYWQVIRVSAGSVLRIGRATDTGTRSYLCISGGIQLPTYLGSRSTFTLGQFGGHAGRSLRIGDVLHFNYHDANDKKSSALCLARISKNCQPEFTHHWHIHVLYGPHAAPDFFTDKDIDTFFASEWEVHYNSSRTGVRLIGPKPEWARRDGGEAGLHPSNIHDNAYAIGAIDFTGDMPVILGPDGPSLGGFVCPAVVIAAERWKLGQLRPGDKISFIPVSPETAQHLEQRQQTILRSLLAPTEIHVRAKRPSPILYTGDSAESITKVVYRSAGDKYLLVEYGPLVLDINLRFRVHALWQWLTKENISGIIDITPGIRSLQIHYDSCRLSRKKLLDCLQRAEQELSSIEDSVVPARDIWLPLSWDDVATKIAIEKYMQSVNKDAPWCPSNIEFIRRINGLADEADVKRIVFDAEYLVMGLGDVYLGAPVATPLDPRHRLVTTKYNPARTWTPENAVGIGGSYLCVYGMEGPGGYQFVGRTLQMWNRWRKTTEFEQPWLLRFFDRIHFFPVSGEELLDIRDAFPRGDYHLRIEESTFSLRNYNDFLKKNTDSIAVFKQQQQNAFDAERERWQQSGYNAQAQNTENTVVDDQEITLAENEVLISSHVPGSVWQISIQAGDIVEAAAPIVIVESMKMEIAVSAPQRLRIQKILATTGMQVQAGSALAIAEMIDGT